MTKFKVGDRVIIAPTGTIIEVEENAVPNYFLDRKVRPYLVKLDTPNEDEEDEYWFPEENLSLERKNV